MLYRGFDRKALDAAYNNTEAVGQARRDQYVAGWTARSDAFRGAHAGRLDLRVRIRTTAAPRHLPLRHRGRADSRLHPRRLLAGQ